MSQLTLRQRQTITRDPRASNRDYVVTGHVMNASVHRAMADHDYKRARRMRRGMRAARAFAKGAEEYDGR